MHDRSSLYDVKPASLEPSKKNTEKRKPKKVYTQRSQKIQFQGKGEFLRRNQWHTEFYCLCTSATVVWLYTSEVLSSTTTKTSSYLLVIVHKKQNCLFLSTFFNLRTLSRSSFVLVFLHHHQDKKNQAFFIDRLFYSTLSSLSSSYFQREFYPCLSFVIFAT